MMTDSRKGTLSSSRHNVKREPLPLPAGQHFVHWPVQEQQSQCGTQQAPGLYPPVQGFYPCGPVLIPFWMQPCLIAQPFPQPVQNCWRVDVPSGDNAQWGNPKSKLRKANSADSGTGVFLPSDPGTGVFLPKGQTSEENLEVMIGEVTCSESDGDSNESTSDCVLVEEKRLFKRGQLSTQVSIEELLPQEWEY